MLNLMLELHNKIYQLPVFVFFFVLFSESTIYAHNDTHICKGRHMGTVTCICCCLRSAIAPCLVLSLPSLLFGPMPGLSLPCGRLWLAHRQWVKQFALDTADGVYKSLQAQKETLIFSQFVPVSAYFKSYPSKKICFLRKAWLKNVWQNV
jgi:hypothetical protein